MALTDSITGWHAPPKLQSITPHKRMCPRATTELLALIPGGMLQYVTVNRREQYSSPGADMHLGHRPIAHPTMGLFYPL
jgi:hypothetical protein